MRATSRVLRYAAVGLLLLFAVLGAVFAAGYAYADLALGLALALTVGWLALAGGLGWLAWRRPDTAVPVLLGLTDAEHIEIKSGIAEDALVVAKSGTFLRHGDRVRPVEIQRSVAHGQ